MANRSIINGSPMGIYQYELMADGRLVFLGANPAADKIIGIDHSQFIGRRLRRYFPTC
jgi:PAS domain-containing protein